MLTGASLVKWALVFTKQAQKDSKKLSATGLKPKAERLLKLLELNPFQTPPPYEKLVGDLAGAYSRRINIATSARLSDSRRTTNRKGHSDVDTLRVILIL